jgi:hypothetical protein
MILCQDQYSVRMNAYKSFIVLLCHQVETTAPHGPYIQGSEDALEFSEENIKSKNYGRP